MTSASADGALVFTGKGDSAGWTGTVVPAPQGPYTMQVEVNSTIGATQGRAVGAGLLFGFNRPNGTRGRSFYAALVTGDTVTVYHYDGSFSMVMRSGGGSPGSRGGRGSLRVSVQGNGFTVSLNGNGSVSQDSDGPMTGDFGVLASGEGEAEFRNLKVQAGTGR